MLMKKKENNVGEVVKLKQTALIIIISFLLILIMVIISNQYGVFFPGFRLEGFEEGKVASRDLIADHNYTYTDSKATDEMVRDRLASTPPVFELDNEKINFVLNDFFIFSQKYLMHRESPNQSLRSELSSWLIKLFDLEEIQFLLDDVDPYIVIPAASDLLEEILDRGVVENTEKVSLKDIESIEVWRWKSGRKQFSTIDKDSILTVSDIDRIVEEKLVLRNIQNTEKYAIHLIVDRFIKENVFFDEIQTELKYDKIKKEIDPVIEEIYSGDYIIRSGFIVTAKDIEKARVLNTRVKNINIREISAVFLFLILIYIFSILMFKPLFMNKRRKYQYIYLLISFYFVFILYTSVISQFNFTNSFILALFLPTALFSMMIVILIGFEESIISVIILSMSLFLFSDATIPSFIFSFVTGISAAFLIKGAEKRIDLVKSAAFLAVINILVLLIGLPQNLELNWLFFAVLWAALNAFLSSVINLTLIPVFEHFLNIPTVFRLMELSDMNAPLFRKMVTMAPGTYGHSVAVASLADAACREIGANPLLARVGAYYHDIGKLDQPEYFIENQTEANKHDMLNPSLSVAVIKSHVKVGIERAKEMSLPFEIIEIIAQHHGSGLIGYFYIEAINKEGSDSKIKPEDYSYTGIPPESKEAAVVMLADTVEAASRVLKKPTINKLEKFIWKLIMEKIERGQMANSALTMNDMLIIKKSFLQILSGYFHTRIEYPKIKRKAV